MGTLLQRVFEKPMYYDLVSKGTSRLFNTTVNRYVKDAGCRTYCELINELYRDKIGKNYRTEYFYKNTLFNKLLLKRHSLRTTVAFAELPIGKARADFVMINGKGCVYEVKTELDNLDRLQAQIGEYYKAFSLVNIVTYRDNIENVEQMVSDSVGIIELTKRGALKEWRQASEYSEMLDPTVIFRMLRKKEYEEILHRLYGTIPECDDFSYFHACEQMFCQINRKEARDEMLKMLKRRKKEQDMPDIYDVPEALRLLVYSDQKGNEYWPKLQPILDEVYGG